MRWGVILSDPGSWRISLRPRTKDALVVVVVGLAGVALVVRVALVVVVALVVRIVDIMLVDGDTTGSATAN